MARVDVDVAVGADVDVDVEVVAVVSVANDIGVGVVSWVGHSYLNVALLGSNHASNHGMGASNWLDPQWEQLVAQSTGCNHQIHIIGINGTVLSGKQTWNISIFNRYTIDL